MKPVRTQVDRRWWRLRLAEFFFEAPVCLFGGSVDEVDASGQPGYPRYPPRRRFAIFRATDWLSTSQSRIGCARPIRQRDGSTAPKIVLGFVGKQKRLILTKTQGLAISAALGDRTEGWPGAQLQLREGRVHNGKPTIIVIVSGALASSPTSATVPAPEPEVQGAPKDERPGEGRGDSSGSGRDDGRRNPDFSRDPLAEWEEETDAHYGAPEG